MLCDPTFSIDNYVEIQVPDVFNSFYIWVHHLNNGTLRGTSRRWQWQERFALCGFSAALDVYWLWHVGTGTIVRLSYCRDALQDQPITKHFVRGKNMRYTIYGCFCCNFYCNTCKRLKGSSFTIWSQGLCWKETYWLFFFSGYLVVRVLISKKYFLQSPPYYLWLPQLNRQHAKKNLTRHQEEMIPFWTNRALFFQ